MTTQYRTSFRLHKNIQRLFLDTAAALEVNPNRLINEIVADYLRNKGHAIELRSYHDPVPGHKLLHNVRKPLND